MEKFMKKVIWLIILAPAVYLAIVWGQLPERVAMHSNLNGVVDRYGSKKELLLLVALLSLLNAGVYLLLTNMYRIDPNKYAADNKSRLHRIGFAASVFLAAIFCLVIYSSTHGNIKFIARLILAGTGLLFAVFGNYMHNIKPNHFAGYRLPWALNNDENWKKTCPCRQIMVCRRIIYWGYMSFPAICCFFYCFLYHNDRDNSNPRYLFLLFV